MLHSRSALSLYMLNITQVMLVQSAENGEHQTGMAYVLSWE